MSSYPRIARLSALIPATTTGRASTRLGLARPASASLHTSTARRAQQTLNSQAISEVTQREQELTGQPKPVQGGPTAQAQKHANEPISSQSVSDITKGEEGITGRDGPVAGGPAAFAQSKLTSRVGQTTQSERQTHSGKLDAETISRITHAETTLSGNSQPVPGGPTAQAQKHAGEPITSQSLHDITEGEKRMTGADRAVKGGPTAQAQSELGKSRISS